MKADSMEKTASVNLASRPHSSEIAGLGLIACLIVAFGSLVAGGSLPLSQYLVFAAFLLVSAGGLGSRMVKLAPARRASSANPRQGG